MGTCNIMILVLVSRIIRQNAKNLHKEPKGDLKHLIGFGGSPRATISLAMASKSMAFIRRRGYVVPEDVRAVCSDVLRHRIGLTYEAEAENINQEHIVESILNSVQVP